MLVLLILYYRKQINYDLSDCLHASVTELRHICISKRWGSKLSLMKAAKVNINKRILSTLCFFLHCSICPSYGEIKKNCGIPAWYQYNWRNPMTLQKCRSFCVLNKKTQTILHPRPWGDHVLSYTWYLHSKVKYV